MKRGTASLSGSPTATSSARGHGSSDAFSDRADEEGDADAAGSSRVAAQLVSGEKAFSSGVVEGLNAKAKVTTRKAYGFKTFQTFESALYHNLGALPEPVAVHRFF